MSVTPHSAGFFAFYLDDKFSHCGVDAFQLFKGNTGWEIFQLTDTRKKEGCVIPVHIKKVKKLNI